MVIKSKEQAKKNFEESVSYIPDRYRDGVAVADWATPAGSDQAEKNYSDGVAKAAAAKRRQKAIKKVPNEEWKSAATDKGAPIIGERISKAIPKWDAKWGPMYDQVVTTVKALPAKTTDWRSNITNRSFKTVESWKKAAGKL